MPVTRSSEARVSVRTPVLRVLAIGVAVALFATGHAAAEDVLHFENGTTMTVTEHRVEGDMLHVELGRGGEMAFPLSRVERITRGGRDVFSEGRANVSAPSQPGAGRGSASALPPQLPVTGAGGVQSRYTRSTRSARERAAAVDTRLQQAYGQIGRDASGSSGRVENSSVRPVPGTPFSTAGGNQAFNIKLLQNPGNGQQAITTPGGEMVISNSPAGKHAARGSSAQEFKPRMVSPPKLGGGGN